MTNYNMWKDMPTTTQNSYQGGAKFGTRFETSHDGEYWIDKSMGSPFYRDNYYRVKETTIMTQDTMTPFLHLDPVKQGEILVAFRNGDTKLQQWLWASETWGDVMFAKRIFDDTVYRIRSAPRECYVRWDRGDTSPVSSPKKFDGSVLMREVMED
jgi:hypothetical protein